MEISICAILRDNGKYLEDFLLPALKTIEKDHNLFYYFYENDSSDNTKELLNDFMKNRKGKILCEDFDTPIFARNTNPNRIKNLTKCRNKLLDLRPFKGEWVILIDSDIIFPLDIVEQFLKIEKPKDLIAMGCNGKDNMECLFHRECYIYYDSLAFKDTDNILNYNKSFLRRHSCNPFTSKEDKTNWEKGKLVKVNSAFGGLFFYKTDIMNIPTLKYEMITSIPYEADPNLKLNCEHWDFNEKLRKFGDIYINPKIIIKHK